MTRFRLLLAVTAVLIALPGCEGLKGLIGKDRPRSTEPLAAVQPDQLVRYLNERAARLQTIQYDDVQMSVKGQGLILPVGLSGSLAANQPHNFRMIVDGRLAGKVDLGSNDQEFWMYLDAAGPKPVYVFASHTDFEAGKAKLPGGLPFEPDWVMQALGMKTLPLPDTQTNISPGTPTNHYTASPPDQKKRTYTLSWPSTLPDGTSVVKEIIFDGDAATGNRPQVKKHLIHDKRGRLICSAEIKRAETVQLSHTDPATGLPLAVQYPTHVVLWWEEQKSQLDLELRKAQVNKALTPQDNRSLFTRRDYGVQPLNMAGYNEFSPK